MRKKSHAFGTRPTFTEGKKFFKDNVTHYHILYEVKTDLSFFFLVSRTQKNLFVSKHTNYKTNETYLI